MPEDYALLVDVGSTWTKAIAVSMRRGRLLARAQTPTSVIEGVMLGVRDALAQVRAKLGYEPSYRAATSSAAGGLRVASVGLVPDLTSAAARQASLGAGARVVFTGSFVLDRADLTRIAEVGTDIVLLSGGTDGGNRDVILENAYRLAAAQLGLAIVLAGNKSATEEAETILTTAGYDVRRAANVLPELDRLEVESAQAAIRELFLERIVTARGIGELREWSAGRLLPTPRAVLEAASLLAGGPAALGTTVVVDIGGATTDVHSIGSAQPLPGVVLRGLAEPHAKRTVEGDLGLRVSAVAAVEALESARLREVDGWTPAALRAEATLRSTETSLVAEGDEFDRVLGVSAVAEALTRHAGTLDELPTRPKTWAQRGKDLREAEVVIGSGGLFAARADSPELLAAAVGQAKLSDRLVPHDARLLVDRDYVLFAVGLLAEEQPEIATSLALASFGLEASRPA